MSHYDMSKRSYIASKGIKRKLSGRAAMDQIVCVACGETKTIGAFTVIKGTPYVHRRCKPCRAARARDIRRARRTKAQRDERSSPETLQADCRASPQICIECGELKPQSAYLPIHGTAYVYRRCRTCRNTRARARYHNDPSVANAARLRSREYKRRKKRTAPAVRVYTADAR